MPVRAFLDSDFIHVVEVQLHWWRFNARQGIS